jgi:hypothetical protein
VIVKEMQEAQDKVEKAVSCYCVLHYILQGKKPLKTLLKVEGVEIFKKRAWQSMHLTAGSDGEEETWSQLVRELREVRGYP